MFNNLGRLDNRDIKDNEAKINKIFSFIEAGNAESARTNIVKLLDTSNYFLREYVGKKLCEYHDGEAMDQVIVSLIGHKVYGVRAAILFYYYEKYKNEPKNIIQVLDMSWSDTPWETEQILTEMWKKHQKLMKTEMLRWAESQFDKQKAFAYHGVEAITKVDPLYVLSLVEKNLDFPNGDVQKKIINALVGVLRAKPADCYSFVREWLTSPSESRTSSIQIAMRRLISISIQNHNNKPNKVDELYLLTMQVVNDWKSDPDPTVSELGTKLAAFAKKPILSDNEF